jgi:aminoglycoside phosphotransferase (APT) family kinase protein
VSDELKSALSTYLAEKAGQAVTITTLTRISDGWESDVFALDAPEWKPHSHILRLYFGADAGPKASHEYRSLDLLARAGYPVPQVDLVEPSTGAVGRSFLIMQRIAGTSLGKRLREIDAAAQEREITRFCALFAKLHTLDWQHLSGAEYVPTVTIAQQLAFWNSLGAQNPSHSLTRAIAWLQEASATVTPLPLGLVHWDFHHENILIDAADKAWVIDWTQFQATDTRFDFAWTLVLLASERDEEMAQAVRRGYLAQRGWDEEMVASEMRFFEAAASAKRLLSVLISMSSGADALGMRPGAEAIMSSRLPRFATVYKQWLAITATPLPEVESMLADYL